MTPSGSPDSLRRPTAENPLKVINVAGARPNFMKIAPIVRAMREEPLLSPILVHTGQHYDKELSEELFSDLEIPAPEVNLGVGSGRHGEQTARVLEAFEKVLLDRSPDLVLVVGDVNSTLACGLAASKLHIPVAHVEAGLRSFDRRMPEETNRVLTDALSDYLFTTEPAGEENLLREGICPERIFSVGNVMIDTLLRFKEPARQRGIVEKLNLKPEGFGVVTLHRPENVDDPETLQGALEGIRRASESIPLVFPLHPRTRARLEEQGAMDRLGEGVRLLPSVGYLDFLGLLLEARLVLTDSGGIQEEATVLGIPCLTLRENTERPITLECGTNRLVGADPGAIAQETAKVLSDEKARREVPPYWDGGAAQRIVDVLIGGVSRSPRGPRVTPDLENSGATGTEEAG